MTVIFRTNQTSNVSSRGFTLLCARLIPAWPVAFHEGVENLWEVFASAFSRTRVIFSHSCLIQKLGHLLISWVRNRQTGVGGGDLTDIDDRVQKRGEVEQGAR